MLVLSGVLGILYAEAGGGSVRSSSDAFELDFLHVEYTFLSSALLADCTCINRQLSTLSL
jgi:hypothetical protein